MYDLAHNSIRICSGKILAMIVSLRHLLGWVVSTFRSREDLVLENLALRQQLRAVHAQRPRRRLTALHELFWVALKTFWSGWRKPLILITPRTVAGVLVDIFDESPPVLADCAKVGEMKARVKIANAISV